MRMLWMKVHSIFFVKNLEKESLFAVFDDICRAVRKFYVFTKIAQWSFYLQILTYFPTSFDKKPIKIIPNT